MITSIQLQVLEALLKNSVISDIGEVEDEFLTIALQLERINSIPILVRDPNYKLKETGMTLLEYAVCWGKRASMKKLLEMGANPNLYRFRPLLIVARDIDMFRELLTYGANPDLQDDYGMTALMRAISKEFVIELLEHKVEVELRDKEGRTALQHLCRNKEVVEMLLEYGAEIGDME